MFIEKLGCAMQGHLWKYTNYNNLRTCTHCSKVQKYVWLTKTQGYWN